MMKLHGFMAASIVLMSSAGAALAQETASSAMVTDRPGLLFSSSTVGPGAFVVELGVPQVTLVEDSDVKVRLTSLVALLRYGVGRNFELRLGAPVYNKLHAESGPFHDDESGFGDVEVGAKWHLLDNAGSRPSFALIPSVILPTGDDQFSAGDPVYQLNAMAEWTLPKNWSAGALVGVLNGPDGDGRYYQETVGLSAGQQMSKAWSAYGEAVYAATGLEGAGDSAFLGAGIKYLVADDLQLDLSFDRGLTGDSPDWLFGLGVSAGF